MAPLWLRSAQRAQYQVALRRLASPSFLPLTCVEVSARQLMRGYCVHHHFPAALSMSRWWPETSHGGSTYTMEIGKH